MNTVTQTHQQLHTQNVADGRNGELENNVRFVDNYVNPDDSYKQEPLNEFVTCIHLPALLTCTLIDYRRAKP